VASLPRLTRSEAKWVSGVGNDALNPARNSGYDNVQNAIGTRRTVRFAFSFSRMFDRLGLLFHERWLQP
jgi:hypothetical protein